MVVPVDREGKVGDSTLLRRESTASTSLEASSTRKAGGRQLNQETQTVSKLVWCMIHIMDSWLLSEYFHSHNKRSPYSDNYNNACICTST